MINSDYWREPPLAGTEAEHLFGALDRLRTTFRWKADDLDAAVDGLVGEDPPAGWHPESNRPRLSS